MFNWIIYHSLKQRLLVLGIAVLLLLYGLWLVPHMSVDVFPDLNKPTVTLLTESGAMSPEEVEQLVTFPIESAMNGMAGVSRVRSISGVGLSVVYVEFEWGADIYRKRQQISERLNTLNNQLPEGVVPQLSPVSSIMGEIILLALPLQDTQANPMQVREYVDWVMRPRLLSVAGVSQVTPIGGEVKQYRVEPMIPKLQQFELSLSELYAALQQYGMNASGGFVQQGEREYLLRILAQNSQLDDLQKVIIYNKKGQAIRLHQVAAVSIAPAPIKRGDASFMAKPAVILSIQKQPQADTTQLTRTLEKTIAQLNQERPKGMPPAQFLFKQANFIQTSISNVQEALRDGAIVVALVLWIFLANVRTTLISLTAIPLSLLSTALVFYYMGLSINTMTLGGLAIAMGELVDDAVVDVENILRRLRQHRLQQSTDSVLKVIWKASQEVRSGIVYATAIVILVFVPLFALPGIEGRLFTPLGVAYIVAILGSLLVSLTVTPVLCYYLLPSMPMLKEGESRVVLFLKDLDTRLLQWSFKHQYGLIMGAMLLVISAAVSVPFLAKSFLPPFNEGTLTVSMGLAPSTSLALSNQIGQQAERLLLSIPEVELVGRRTGRAELDEHAEGIHSSDIDVGLKPSKRSKAEIIEDIRQRLAVLPASINIGQPISHRLDHLLSGVRAQIVVKIMGDDLSVLHAQATNIKQRLSHIRGLTDLQIEKQVFIPQYTIKVDYQAATQYQVNVPQLVQQLSQLLGAERVGQIIEKNRRFDLNVVLAESERQAHQLAQLLIDTPMGAIPLAYIARIEESQGLNQIGRENTQRRIVIFANTDGSDMANIVANIRAELNKQALPAGYFTQLEGQFKAQEQAAQRMTMLAGVSLVLMILVLYSRYRSMVFVAMIMLNIPLALVGAVAALWLSGQPLSVAALVGFVALAGISTRNGILKISHYINLCLFEGEQFGQQMIIRGSLERLTPVLMTALVTALALVPLLLSPEAAGKEILYPVAVVIFGGLMSSTLLDTLLTPVVFGLFGQKPLNRILQQSHKESF